MATKFYTTAEMSVLTFNHHLAYIHIYRMHVLLPPTDSISCIFLNK